MRHAVAVHNRRHGHVTQYRVVRLEGILCWTPLNLPCSYTYQRTASTSTLVRQLPFAELQRLCVTLPEVQLK